MPERQEPFIHENGKLVLRRPKPAELTTDVLARLVKTLTELRERAGQGDPRLADARREPYDLMIGIVSMLREPGFNSVALAFAALPPAEAAILGDLAAALLDAGKSRHLLLANLRELLRGET